MRLLTAAVPVLQTEIQTQVQDVVEDPQGFVDRLEQIGRDAIGPGLEILLIIIITLILLRALRMIVRKTIEHLMDRGDQTPRELALKANTLSSVVESGGRMVILVVAGMMMLTNIGVNIAPLIASAGVVGIAIGLGAQSIIRDFIGGFLILFEDQYGVGDVISVGPDAGVVEHLSLRRTGIRGLDGGFTIIPNGDIRTVKNLTKDWSRALLDVDVSYEDDVDHAIAVLKDLLNGIEDDPELGDVILAPAEILGVEALGAYQVTIRLMVKTKPMEQWRVQRELRRRIKQALQQSGVTIPYPHNVTVFRPVEHGSDNRDQQATALLSAAKHAPGGTS